MDFLRGLVNYQSVVVMLEAQDGGAKSPPRSLAWNGNLLPCPIGLALY